MSKPIDDGGPAFPVTELDVAGGHWDGRYEVKQQHAGLSLRDYFAIHANDNDIYVAQEEAWKDAKRTISRTEARYRHADAMLTERSRDRE